MVEQIVNESSADGDTVIDVIDVKKSYQIVGMEIPIGFSVSVIVGLIAGVYPANKAAEMNTVDTLRHE